MILGIGSDLVDVRRIEKALERFGDRFIERCYTAAERERAERHPKTRAASYAKRFAAKEACSKALGTGVTDGVFLRDMGVVNLKSGQPSMHLTGGAAERLAKMTPQGRIPCIHISLTDDYPVALGFVMISAELVPIEPGPDAGSR